MTLGQWNKLGLHLNRVSFTYSALDIGVWYQDASSRELVPKENGREALEAFVSKADGVPWTGVYFTLAPTLVVASEIEGKRDIYDALRSDPVVQTLFGEARRHNQQPPSLHHLKFPANDAELIVYTQENAFPSAELFLGDDVSAITAEISDVYGKKAKIKSSSISFVIADLSPKCWPNIELRAGRRPTARLSSTNAEWYFQFVSALDR